MKRVWKITTALAGAALIVFLVLLGLGVYTLYEYMHPVGRTTSLEPVEFIIEGHRFRIPMAYIREWEKWGGGEVVSINLKASLPDLKPYSEETKHYYERLDSLDPSPGLGELVSFSIEEADEGQMFLFESYFIDEFLQTCSGLYFGYRVCPHDRYDYKEIFLKQEGQRKIAFDCEKEDVAYVEYAGQAQYCATYLPFIDRIELRILIDRKKFAQSEEIIAAVYRLVCGFYLEGAGRAITYNYCITGG